MSVVGDFRKRMNGLCFKIRQKQTELIGDGFIGIGDQNMMIRKGMDLLEKDVSFDGRVKDSGSAVDQVFPADDEMGGG